jgi:hypothetical protein
VGSGLFGNLLAGQWLQVLALWLGAQLLSAPAGDLQADAGKRTSPRYPCCSPGRGVLGLLPEPCGKGKAGRDTTRAREYANPAKR